MKMKKIAVCAAMVALLFMGVFAGCQTDSGAPDLIWPSSMTFADNPSDPGRIFTINEDLEFNVEFVNLDGFDPELAEAFAGLGITPGVVVYGEVDVGSGNAWTSTIITGMAGGMGAYPPHPALDTMLPDINIEIALTFTIANNNIASIDVVFPAAVYEDPEHPNYDMFAGISMLLMGGTFHRIPD